MMTTLAMLLPPPRLSMPSMQPCLLRKNRDRRSELVLILCEVVALFTNLFFGRQHFGNYDHHDPVSATIPGDHGTKPFPNKKSGSNSHLMEYPLPNMNNAHLGGPARIVLHHKDGELKYAGVVSHDQSRGANHAGVHDHFRIART
jgi:hypothetical protein